MHQSGIPCDRFIVARAPGSQQLPDAAEEGPDGHLANNRPIRDPRGFAM